MSSYLPRTLEKIFLKANGQFKALRISGMRQVGKTTLLSHLKQSDRQFVSLDDLLELEDARHQPTIFFRNHPLPLYLDEIQRAPELFLPLKATIDAQNETGVVWMTGSQRFRLMKNASESLVGRVIEFELMPFSIYEAQGLGLEQKAYVPTDKPHSLLTKHDRKATIKKMWQGLWPGAQRCEDADDWQLFYRSIVQTYLERDIRAELNIEKLAAFQLFLKALALRSGQELRIGVLAQMSGVSEPTIKRWLSVAESSGLIYCLKPFYNNLSKQLVKSPKVYFTDVGLLCYLCGLHTPDDLEKYQDIGAVFETFVVSEILKSWVHNGKEAQLYFIRDSQTKEEIDLLIHANNTYHPVEIKWSEHPTSAMLKNFAMLSKQNLSVGLGSVICMTEKPRWLEENVIAHSIWEI